MTVATSSAAGMSSLTGCYFDTFDDCMVIKSGRGRDGLVSPRRENPSRDVVLRNNRVSRGGGALAIGSEQAAGIHHIYVDGLIGDNAGLYTGVLIKANPQFGAGIIEEIHIRNVALAGVRYWAAHIDLTRLQHHDRPLQADLPQRLHLQYDLRQKRERAPVRGLAGCANPIGSGGGEHLQRMSREPAWSKATSPD